MKCCCCGVTLGGIHGGNAIEWCDWCNNDLCWGVDEDGNEVSFHAPKEEVSGRDDASRSQEVS